MGISILPWRRREDTASLPKVGRLRKTGVLCRRAVFSRAGGTLFMLACAILAVYGAFRDSHVKHVTADWYINTNRYAGILFETLLLEKNPPTGAFHTDFEAIDTIKRPYSGMPLLSVPIRAIKDEVEKLPWSDTVAVRRRFPSAIEIIIKEHVPAAVWQQDGRFYVINTGGEIIEETEDYRLYKELMLVSGIGAAEQIQNLMDMLTTYPAVLERVASASFVGQRRWDMYLKTGVLVSMPEDNPRKRMKKLDSMIKKGYLESSPLKTIDMRSEKRIYIELKNGPGSYFDGDEDAS